MLKEIVLSVRLRGSFRDDRKKQNTGDVNQVKSDHRDRIIVYLIRTFDKRITLVKKTRIVLLTHVLRR